MTRKPPHRIDADALLVRRTAIRVGLWITTAVAVLVIAAMVAAITFVFRQIPLADLFDRNRHEEMVDIGGLDIIVGGVALGLLAIVLAGTLGLLATRRAIAPLVDALARQRRFVADASHELRTPLAVLDTRLQVLDRAMPPDDPNRALVDELRGDSRNVINVVNDLLDSVEVSSSGVVTPEPIAPTLQGAVTSMAVIAQERGVVLVLDPVPGAICAGIPAASLQRALVAVLDNAIKHSPAGEPVEVSAGADRAAVWISVRDHGRGIRGIDPERIFDRFARSSLKTDGGGSARSGFGIGLSLVQDTLGRYGGMAEATDSTGTGTTITLRLPRGRR